MEKLVEASAPFENAFKRYCFGRKFCTTTNGYMGWVSSKALKGNCLCYFEGCKLPFVIRPCVGGYQLVGDCYLHGLTYDLLQVHVSAMIKGLLIFYLNDKGEE